MALIKKGQNVGIATPEAPVEKHFHDHDETWVVLEGEAKSFTIDHAGQREEHILRPGDCLMIEAGWEHGAVPITPEFKVVYIYGTRPPGSHEPGHYYMERERYIPSLELRKTPTGRYR